MVFIDTGFGVKMLRRAIAGKMVLPQVKKIYLQGLKDKQGLPIAETV
jgi:hypothetical protein